jgi:Protein of unknown function (DUF2628)
MSIYTVHEPPLRAGTAAPEPDRYVFIRDGFSFWAFLFGPLWMLRHRMWLVFVLYVVIALVLEGLVAVASGSDALIVAIGLLLAFWVGLEAATLRRFTLRQSGWRDVGVISGEDREAAERRFFDAWLQEGTQIPARAVTSLHAINPHQPTTSGVIGLFPEPGARR